MKFDEKTLRVIEFSGKKSDWKIWSRKFLARGNKRGYKEIIEGKISIPSKALYDAMKAKIDPTPSDEKNIKNYEKSISAFEDLILSINGESKAGRVAFDLVDGCNTLSNPDGDVKLAWTRLVHKYEPKTAPSYIQLNREFANSKLEIGEDPDEWITKLESLRTQMNKIVIPGKTEMSDVDLIIHILATLGDEYEVAVSSLEDRMTSTTKPLEVEEVREKIILRHDRIEQHEKEEIEEKAYSAFKEQYYNGSPSGSNQDDKKDSRFEQDKTKEEPEFFPGNCYRCGKWGHKRIHCKNSEKRKTRRLISLHRNSVAIALRTGKSLWIAR